MPPSPHPESSASHPVIALIAGEASGDQLGSDLIAALHQRYPQARCVGVGGPRMAAQEFEAWHDVRELSVMGFAEVLKHLPRLVKLRRQLTSKLLAMHPDVVIGIDAPDFNLGLERKLKQAGIPTVHYVSPSIWAWREKRVRKIGRSADRVLCLFPMEPPIYTDHGIDARFVGHPLATRFPMVSDRAGARDALDLPMDVPVLAVMPGSRRSEIERLGEIFLDAAQRVSAAVSGLQIIVPAANTDCHTLLQHAQEKIEATAFAAGRSAMPRPRIIEGRAHEAMQAADIVLLASGTATLEAMLAKRPMVVGYRVAPASYRIARMARMLKTDIYALPNILSRADDAAAPLPVPELMQDDCRADALATATIDLLRDSQRRNEVIMRFEHLHQQLAGDLEGSPAEHAANAVSELIEAH